MSDARAVKGSSRTRRHRTGNLLPRSASAEVDCLQECGQPIQLTADQQARVTTYMPFARHVARTFRHRSVPIEDLEQVAYIGLINAVHNFNPARNVKFETYARHMVAGEIRHYIRDHGGVVKKPRRLYEMHSRIRRAVNELLGSNGQRPTMGDVARHLSVDESDVHEAVMAHDSLRTLSLDEERHGDDGTAILAYESITDPNSKDAEQIIVELRDLVAQLPPSQTRAILLYYFCDRRQGDVAELMGISQKHVSHLLRMGCNRLAQLMNGGLHTSAKLSEVQR